MKINFKSGIFRVWVVISILWVAISPFLFSDNSKFNSVEYFYNYHFKKEMLLKDAITKCSEYNNKAQKLNNNTERALINDSLEFKKKYKSTYESFCKDLSKAMVFKDTEPYKTQKECMLKLFEKGSARIGVIQSLSNLATYEEFSIAEDSHIKNLLKISFFELKDCSRPNINKPEYGWVFTLISLPLFLLFIIEILIPQTYKYIVKWTKDGFRK